MHSGTGNPIIQESAGLRKLQGCALGCLVILLVVVASGIALYYWASTPGPQIATEAILGADSLGLLHVEGLKDDPGLRGMVGDLLVSIQELRNQKLRVEQVPWVLRALIFWQREIDPDDIDDSLEDLPRDVTVSLEPLSGAAEPQLVAAINLNRFPRLLRLIFAFSGFGEGSVQIDGNPAYRLNSAGNVLTFADSTVLWGQSLEVVTKVLRRSPDAPGTGISEILSAYRTRDLEWDIYGVILNRENSLEWLLQRLPSGGASGRAISRALGPQLGDLERISLGINVVDEDSVEGELSLLYSNEITAQNHLAVVEKADLLPRLLREAEELETQQTISRRNREIMIHLQARNIQATIMRHLDQAWGRRR